MLSDTLAQIDGTLKLVEQVLGRDVLGAYLHGSAVLGELKPGSDVDILVVSRRPLTADETRQLAKGLLALSGPPLLPLELTLVVQSDVQPWRYAPRMEFQFGEWLRADLERGRQDLGSEANVDLAPLLAVTLLHGKALLGPPPQEVFDPVPHADLVRAIKSEVSELLEGLATDTRHAVLTLARVWCTVVTGTFRTKDAAADWTLPRLPVEHRPVLERARAIYLGKQEEEWSDLLDAVRSYGDELAMRIAKAELDPLSDNPPDRVQDSGRVQERP